MGPRLAALTLGYAAPLCLAAAVGLGLSACGSDDAASPPPASSAGSASPPASSTSAASPGALRYVALGDSYSAGTGVPTTEYADGCGRSDHDYPATLAATIGAELTDVTCGGATTGDLTGSQDTDAGPRPPQLDAVTSATDLVTLGIGANDLSLIGTLQDCAALAARDPSGAPCQAAYSGTVANALETLRPHMAAVLADIEQRAPSAKVVVVGYPQLLPATGTCDALPLARGDDAFVNTTITQLNQLLRDAASRAGATYLDVEDASRGHDLCAAEPWVNGPTSTSEAAALHPYRAEEDAIATMIREQVG